MKEEDKVEQPSITPKSESSFVPDSTLNSVLKLDDYVSSKTFYPTIDNVSLVDFIRPSPVAVFCNKEQTEYLLAYQYEGNTKNSYSCFEVGYTETSQIKETFNRTTIKNFITESGLTLGMSVDELLKIKGQGYASKSDILITYKIDDANNVFLKRYNVPGYFLECTLQNSKVIKFKFGFMYA